MRDCGIGVSREGARLAALAFAAWTSSAISAGSKKALAVKANVAVERQLVKCIVYLVMVGLNRW